MWLSEALLNLQMLFVRFWIFILCLMMPLWVRHIKSFSSYITMFKLGKKKVFHTQPRVWGYT